MDLTKQSVRGSAIVLGAVAVFLLAWDLERHLARAVDKWGDAAGAAKQTMTLADSNEKAIVDEITRPCKGAGDDPNSCGLLADMKKIAIDTKKTVVTTQLQIKQSDTLIQAAADSIRTAGSSFSRTADGATEALASARAELDASKKTTDALTVDIETLQPAIAKIPPIEDKIDSSFARFNELMSRPAIATLEDNAARLSGSAADIGDTLDKVGKKATYKYLHPSTNPAARTWGGVQPYMPLTVKSALCLLVPHSCL